METKLALRLPRRSISINSFAINHLINDLYRSEEEQLRRVVESSIDLVQDKIISQGIGKRGRVRKRKRKTHWHCEHCGNDFLFWRKGFRSRLRQLRTKIGTLSFRLHQVQCRSCKCVFAPILQIWGIRKYQRSSYEYLKQMVESVLYNSYHKASKLTKLYQNGRSPHASTMKRWVDRLGKSFELKPPAAWNNASILADSTKVKAGSKDRGEILQLMIGISSNKKTLLGFHMGRDWNPLIKSITGKKIKSLVTDGDRDIASAHKKNGLEAPVQR